MKKVKQIVKILHIDHFARRVKYFFKVYNLNKNHYDREMFIDELYEDSRIPIQIKEQLHLNPEPFIRYTENNGNESLVGIKYWIDNVYRLRKIKSYTDFRPLMSYNGCLFYIKHNKLYKRDNKDDIYLSDFDLIDRQYSEMVAYERAYAIRSGGIIRVSTNLKKWDTIYQGKRGIKNSMVIVKKAHNIVLIFIEYSPGICYDNHRVLQYDFSTGCITVLKEFLNTRNKVDNQRGDYIRHIHVIQEDPYTNDLYIGTGDSDDESAIYVSHNVGDSWDLVTSGNQLCRTLSFVFSKESVFWNTDTHEKQFIVKLDRQTNSISSFPLLNGALWCTIETDYEGRHFYIMSSNSEGALFDNNNRLYGIEIIDDKPIIYQLLEDKSRCVYSQHFPICTHCTSPLNNWTKL